MIKAIIFDVDGTLADTEKAHLQAFNEAFIDMNIRWRWSSELYTELLKITGGKERLFYYWKHYETADFERHNQDLINTRINLIHAKKTQIYTALIKNEGLPFRPGIQELIETAHRQGIKLAIATTTTSRNVLALLETNLGSDWPIYFPIIEDASTAERKKPDPQAYLQAISRLNEKAQDCIAIEDSENGLKAALAAGLSVVVTPTEFTRHQNFEGATYCLTQLSSAAELLNAWKQTSTTLIKRNRPCQSESASHSLNT